MRPSPLRASRRHFSVIYAAALTVVAAAVIGVLPALNVALGANRRKAMAVIAGRPLTQVNLGIVAGE